MNLMSGFLKFVVCVMELFLKVNNLLVMMAQLYGKFGNLNSQVLDLFVVLMIVGFSVMELNLDVLVLVLHIFIFFCVVMESISIIVTLVLEFLVLMMQVIILDFPFFLHMVVLILQVSTVMVVLSFPLDSNMSVFFFQNMDFSFEVANFVLIIRIVSNSNNVNLVMIFVLPMVAFFSLFVKFFFEMLALFFKVENFCVIFNIVRLSVLEILLSSAEFDC
jgi:hypothetical protein